MNSRKKRHRPTKAELEAARGHVLSDIIVPGLRGVFVGINPSLYSAAVGHHFARPGNRFWPALHASGVTPRLLDPSEDVSLPEYGYGVTNVVPRATVQAAELSDEELRAGGAALRRKLAKYRPRGVIFLGITAYRLAFDRRKAVVGLQDESIGETLVWVLPNPSGLNAHYQLDAFAELFRECDEHLRSLGDASAAS